VAPRDPYLVRLRRARRGIVAALVEGVPLSPAAATEAWAVAGALLLAGLARHDRRRGGDGTAAAAVLAKYARADDLGSPDIAVRAHLAHPRLDPRLGGLLGDASALAAAWLSSRTDTPAPLLARALAACAPLALGALAAGGETPGDLSTRCAGVDVACLESPESLERIEGPPGDTYRHLRRRGWGSLRRR